MTGEAAQEPPASASRRAGLVLLAGFLALDVYFFGAFPSLWNSNELSHFQTVVAFCEDGTFAIDRQIATLGDHADKSAAAGRTYSNKAPGLAFAAIPVYRLLRLFLPPPRGPDSAIVYFVRLLTVTLVSLLALARFERRLRGASPVGTAGAVVLAVAFGTPFLVYSRSFFSHAWTASLLFLSWDVMAQGESGGARSFRRAFSLAGSGFLAAWAATSEYPAALLAVLLAARAAAGRGARGLLLFGAGAAAPLALLAAYNQTCFGSPWTLSTAREAYPPIARMIAGGFFGVSLPKPKVAAAYLFHPARGILLRSPFWLFLVPGFVRWWRSGERRRDAVFALAAAVLFLLVLSGFGDWHAGSSLGNRYLLPVLFLAGLGLAPALESASSRAFFVAAAVYAVLVHCFAGLSWPHFPAELSWPVSTGAAWFLARGWIAPNLAAALGAGPALQIAIAVLILALVLAFVLSRFPLRRSAVAAMAVLGAGAFAAAVLYTPRLSFDVRIWRAAFFDAYSGKDPSREALKAEIDAARSPQERETARRALEGLAR